MIQEIEITFRYYHDRVHEEVTFEQNVQGLLGMRNEAREENYSIGSKQYRKIHRNKNTVNCKNVSNLIKLEWSM